MAAISGGNATLSLNLPSGPAATYSGNLGTGGGGVLIVTSSANGGEVLSGSNAYGNTQISGNALLTAANINAVPNYSNPSNVTISGSGTFIVQGGTAANEFSAANVNSILSNLTWPTGTTFGLNVTDTGAFALANPIGGNEGFLLQGSGTLVSTYANTYSGPTTIGHGATFQLGNGGSLASPSVADSGALVFSGNAATQNYGGVITGNGALTMAGTGSLVLTGSSVTPFTGTTNVSSGSLLLGNANTLQSSTVNLAPARSSA